MKQEIKDEIRIGVNISNLLRQYQDDEFDFDTFIEKSLNEVRKSYYADVDGFTDFLKSQEGNELPNGSSGSSMTAILDLDGLYGMIEEEEDIVDHYGEPTLYDRMCAYQTKLLYLG